MFGWFSRIFRAGVRPATTQDVVDAVKTLLRRLDATEERLDRMEGQFRRLRGYVYAKKGDVLDTAFDDVGSPNGRKAFLEREATKRRLTKQELRELAGLVPLRTTSAPPEQPPNE